MTISRREFIKLTGATVLCACTGAVGFSGCSRSTGAYSVPLAAEGSYRWDGSQVVVSLAAADQLKPVGGAVRLVLAGSDDAALKIVVVHPEDETYCSFADRCTHRGKELDYLHEDRMLQCRSGKAQFDLDGHVIRDPAERVLLVYPTRRQGDHLVITVIV